MQPTGNRDVVSRSQHPTPRGRAPRGFAGFISGLSGLTHQIRMERLAESLEPSRGLAVRYNTWGHFGDRVGLWLDDGSMMHLKLFAPQPGAVSSLLSIRFEQQVGWAVTARMACGGVRTYHAWLARLFPNVAPAQRPLSTLLY
jgi:hypothetical protein